MFLSLLLALTAQAAPPVWGEKLAGDFVELSLHCVETEFPNYWDRFEGKIQPKLRHPAFYGCFDWHSAVHGHWAMLRVWKSFPGIPSASRIEAALERHLSEANIAGELKFLREKNTFENPYGYGWFFRLLKELNDAPFPQAKVWRARLQPIAELFSERYEKSLTAINRPYRIGTHDSTAFAMTHIHDFAAAEGNSRLLSLVNAKAREFFLHDKDCAVDYEPGPFDFISPCLVEAELMEKVLAAKEFERWQRGFFSRVKKGSTIFTPVVPSDIKDPFLGHQIGLMFQKAEAMESVAARLAEKSSLRRWLLDSARVHAEKGLSLMFDSGYGGTHWLASFAIFYFSHAGQAKSQ